MNILEIRNLKKSYKNLAAISSFSATLEEGETLVVIGDSGSGKTTLLRILNFLEKKDEGQIILEGNLIKDINQKETQDYFGLVFQNFNLFPQYTVYENILLPLKNKIRKDNKKYSFKDRKHIYKELLKEKKMEVISLLKEMDLYEKKDAYPQYLSGGQAQRAAIVRAVALSPKVLCLDEPTSALDPQLKREVANAILSLKKKGITMIVVTHEMSLAKNVADKIIFMKKGAIIEKGAKIILEKPATKELAEFLSIGDTEHEKENNGCKDGAL